MALCPGRIEIEIDRHKVYGETAETVILREVKQFSDTFGAILDEMAKQNTIIHLEAATTTKPMPVVEIWHYDIELAIKDALKQIKKWKPEKK